MTSPNKEGTATMTSPGTSSSAPNKPTGALSYMHRPPAILPNYGKKYGGGGIKLKTSVPRVLLYDNITQQTILSVHLSGLQSQKIKTTRELDMQQKSFQHRREIQVKQLENITQVDHHDDYIDFQRDSTTLHASTLSLPNIGSDGRVIRRKRKPKKKNKDGVNWSSPRGNLFSMNSELSLQSGFTTRTDTGNRASIELPSIVRNPTMISLPSSAKGNSVDAKGRVGFREVKSPTGITKLFHSLPGGIPGDVMHTPHVQTHFNDVDEIANPANVFVEMQKPNKQSTNNQAPMTAALRISTSKSHLNQDQPFSIYKSLRKEQSLPVYRKEQSLPVCEPLTDQRYERLKSSLILQDPPNEGYTELSPSFVREEPDWMVRLRRQQLSAARRRRLRNKLKKRMSIEFIRRPDSAGSGAQDIVIGDQPSSDENDEDEGESRSNSALGKMAVGNSVHF